MTAPSVDRARRHAAAGGEPGRTGDAQAVDLPEESPAVRQTLQQAVEEAARLLGADGAFLYLIVPGTGRLRLQHDAGIEDLAERPWVRRLEVEVGKGLFGKAVAERRVQLSGDYPADRSFTHAAGPDRIVREVGIRSLVVAPMVAGDDVYGALGTFSRTADAFTAPQIALVRSLAEHAAQAIANARLIEQLDRSRDELARRAELEKALREIGARISAASDPDEVVQRAVDEALRLIGGEGARIDLVDPEVSLLRGQYTSGAEPPTPEQWPDDPDETLDEGISGKVVVEGRTFWTGSYLDDDRFKHAHGPDTFARTTGIRSAIAAPLVGEHGAFGALTVWSRQADAFGPDEAGVLETIAGQAAVALGRARLIEQLDRSREVLSRRADEERTLREIGARLSEIRDPSDVLQRIVGEVRRLLGAERCRLDLAEPVTGRLLWSDPVDMLLHDMAAIPLGDPANSKGLTAIAIRERRALVSEDYLADDRFAHYPEADREARELGLTSIVVVPVIGESGLLGVLQAAHQRKAAFGEDEVRLVEALASQAAIAITNARLIDRLEQSQTALERTAAAERALREIAARIAVLHDPAAVLDSIVAEAPRLVTADWALIDTVEPTSGRMQWTWPAGQGDTGRSTAGIAAVRAGKRARRGLSSKAIVEQRAVITGDYLADRSFTHDPSSDAFAASIGMRSVIAAPMVGEAGLLGMLQVGSRTGDAFGPEDAARIEVLANEAAVAVTNARLIEELASSREELARTAEAERALREMAARLTAIRDPKELLQDVTRDAARLLGSRAAIIDLLDLETDTFAWGFDVGIEPGLRRRWYAAGLGDDASRLAIETRAGVITADYGSDPRFRAEGHQAFLDEIGLRSLLVVPLVSDEGVLGTLAVLSDQPDRYTAEDAALLQSLADQAAIAVTNARLIEQLAQSREALARTADVERALRELTGRLTVIRDPKELLADVTREAARLLGAEAAVIDLVTEGADTIQWGYGIGLEPAQREEWYRRGLTDAASMLAMASREPVVTGDYAQDPRFDAREHADFITSIGICSMLVVPLGGEPSVLGTLAVVSPRQDAFDAADAAVLQSLADQAAIAVTNARLIEELASSREALRRTADAERTLRENVAELTTIREPRDVLQRIVDAAKRLAGSDMSFLHLLDPASGQLRFEVADQEVEDVALLEDTTDERGLGEGISGFAVRERRAVRTRNYLADDRFVHSPSGDALARARGHMAAIATPLLAEGVVLGVLSVVATDADRFDETTERQLSALADQAAIAIRNAELIRALGQSREETARRAETERTLREIAARITAIRDPEGILELIVEEARRVLGSDGAHLTRLAEDERVLRPVVVAGAADPETATWIKGLEFPVDGGINGLAASLGRVVWTPDYAMDPRIPRDPSDLDVAERLRLGAMAAAPLRAPGGEVIGTLAVNYADPGPIPGDRLEVLQALADHAAIALSNSDLYTRLEASEREFRGLVQASPDVIWRNDAEGRFTFIADSAEQLFGWRPDELVGQPYTMVIAADEGEQALAAWMDLLSRPDASWRRRFMLTRSDGSRFPAEVSAVASWEEGRFLGGQGTLRDISERERLERELRDSEARYRFLVENSPDVIWSLDLDGRFTYISESVETASGWTQRDFLGRHFSEFTSGDTLERVAGQIDDLIRDPHAPRVVRIEIPHKDGTRTVPTELSFVGRVEAGELVGVQGVSRDVTERERLERELRDSEARYRSLVQTSPDVMWGASGDGVFTFFADNSMQLLGYAPDELVGNHFSTIVDADSLADAQASWALMHEAPDTVVRTRVVLRRKDGRAIPTEVSGVSVFEDGRFVAAQGTVRDVSERERLERELRDSEERYRFLVQNSPDVVFATDAEGRFTFVSETIEALVGRAPHELVGAHFSAVIAEHSLPLAVDRWQALVAEPSRAIVTPLDLVHADGHLVNTEVGAVGTVGPTGEFLGITGATRDISERNRLERELRESEERYRFLVENSPDIVYSASVDGRFTYVSESIEKILGWKPGEIVGRRFSDIIRYASPEDVGRRWAVIAQDPSKEITARFELLDRNGDGRPFEVSAVGIVRDGQFAGVHGSARDIGERERLERELRDSEGRYRFLVQSSPDMVWVTDAAGTFTFVSDTAGQILGWRPDEIVGRSFEDLAPPNVRRRARVLFRYLARRPNEPHRHRLPVLTRDGRELVMEISGIAMLVDGRFAGAHGAARDVSERDRLDRDLRRQAAELASSEERAHLARELHDSVTQALFSMTLLSRSIEMLLTRDPSQVPEKLAALRDLQRDALAEMRALIFELRPGNVAENGLIGALRTHAAGLSGRIGLPVVLEGDLPERPALEVEDTLYRIAQEALHNVVKHAGAREVRIEIDPLPDAVRLVVRDDGRGFDPASVPEGHLGLAGMRARAEKLGGRLAVASEPGVGTTVECIIPTRAGPRSGSASGG